MSTSLSDGSVSPCSESRRGSSRNACFVFAIAARYGMRNAFRGVARGANALLTHMHRLRSYRSIYPNCSSYASLFTRVSTYTVIE